MNLKLSVLETNDCKAIQILGVNTPEDWGGISANIAPHQAAGKLQLRLYIKATTSDRSVYYLRRPDWQVTNNAEWDGVDLYDRVLNSTIGAPSTGYFTISGYADLAKFQFNISASEFMNEDGEFEFDIHDLLPDGLYEITYSLYDPNAPGTVDNLSTRTSTAVFISGQIRNEVYQELANLPIETNNIDLKVNNYNETLYAYTLLRAIENNMYVSRRDDMLSGLKTLQKFVLTTKCLKHD